MSDQYVVTALDHRDEAALSRRLAHREAHLTGLRERMRQGQVISAGALLDEAGTMIGSSLHVEVTDRATLDAWLAADPYTVHRVWAQIEIRPIRLAPHPDTLVSGDSA